jgi:dipeptidyl aminopeptidase/acylaminoacyl peptidase
MAADWAPDGKSLAVLRVDGGTRRLEYPLGTLLYASPNDIYCPRVSPKGDEVAFFEYSEKGVAVAVVDRSGAREVLSGGWPDWWLLAWSPAGDEVWFGASVSSGVSSLFAVDRQARLRTLLAAPGMLEIHDVARGGGILVAQVQARAQAFGGRVGGASERNLSWLEDSRVADISPDGALALLSVDSERESGVPAAYLRSMDGSPPVRLGAGKPEELSRDGRWALAIRGHALVALPTAAGEERVLATGLSSILEGRWLPDGLHVLVVGTDPDGSTCLKQIGFEGGPARTVVTRLELRPAVARNTRLLSSVSPDGRFVAAATASGEITVLSLDGGEPRPLPGTGPNDLPVQWSADGRRVFLLDPSQLPARVYAVEVASGKRELWREIHPPDRAGVAGVEAVALTPDATAYVYSYRQYRSDLYLVKGLR